MTGALWPRRMVRLGLLGVAAMTLAVPGILLARGTTGHDWYAARQVTLAEVTIAVGFSESTTVAYRTAYGDTWNIIRAAVAVFPSAVQARRHILATIGDGVMLGAGVGGTVFFLMLLGAAGHGRRARTGTAPEPVEYAHRHLPAANPAGRIADWVRPGLRARIALLVVSPAELERLLALLGHGRRPGFVDLPGPDGVEPVDTDGELLERTETPSLLPIERGAPSADAAAKPEDVDREGRPSEEGAGNPNGDAARWRKREPGAQFF